MLLEEGEVVLEMDGGGSTTMQMYLMSLNHKLKMFNMVNFML